MADIDAPFMQQILNIPERQRKPDIHHHRKANDIRARFEIAKWIRFGHPTMLRKRPARLKQVCSDSAKLYNRMRKALKDGRCDDFVIETLRDDARSFGELQEQEYQEIKKRNTIENGYNTAEGGSLGTPNPIVVDGKDFISQLAAAEHYGIDPLNFNQRINKLHWTPEQAAGLDPDKAYGISVEIEGQSFPSISKACVELGKNYKRVHGRISKYGWTLAQAFDLAPPPKRSKPQSGVKISCSIGEFVSITEAASAVGLKATTVIRRLKVGWTHDQALGLEPAPARKRSKQNKSQK